AHVDVDAARFKTFDDAVRTERDVLNGFAVRHDGEHHGGRLGNRTGRIRPGHTGIDQGVCFFLGPVPAGHLVSRGLPARPHAETHHAAADKPYSHAFAPAASVILLVAVLRNRAVEFRMTVSTGSTTWCGSAVSLSIRSTSAPAASKPAL